MSILKVQDFPTDPTTAVFTGAEPVNSVFAGPASGAASAPGFRPLVPDDIPSGVKLINANYTVTGADNGLLLVSNVSGSITVTLPNPPPLSSFDISIENPTPGALSISPNGLLLDGSASSLSVSKNQGLYIATDGVNYYSERGMGTGGGGGGTPGGTTGQLQYNSSGAFAGAAGSSVAASGAIGLGAAPAAGYDLDVTASAANGGTAHVAKSATFGVAGTAQDTVILIGNASTNPGSSKQTQLGVTSSNSVRGVAASLLGVADAGFAWQTAIDTSGNMGVANGLIAKSVTSPAINLDFTGSSQASPALIQGINVVSGTASRISVNNGADGIQGGYGVQTQLFGYQGLRLGGNRNTTPPAFVVGTGNDPSVTIDAPLLGTGPTLQVNGLATVSTPSGTNASVSIVESGTPSNYCQIALVEVGANYFTDTVVADGVVRATTGKALRLGTGTGTSSLVLSGGKVTGVSGVNTVGMGVPAIVAVAGAGTSGSTSYAVALLTPGPVGNYRASAFAYNTTAASGTIGITITFRSNTVVQTLTVCPAVTVGAANTWTQGTLVFRHDLATANISATVNVSVAATNVFYYVFLEQLS